MLEIMSPMICSAHHELTCFSSYYGYTLLTQLRRRRRGKKVQVGTDVKANIGLLYEEVREVFTINMRRDLTGVV